MTDNIERYLQECEPERLNLEERNHWNAVTRALSQLYELHGQPYGTEKHMAVEELMDAYDQWLN